MSIFQSSQSGDSIVQVYEPSGRPFAFNAGSADTGTFLKMRLPESGVYVVQSIYGTGSGPYETIVNQDEPGLFIDDEIIGRVGGDRIDSFTFFGLAGDGISILLESELGLAETQLIGPDAAILALGIEQGLFVPAIAVPLPFDGFYTVLVQSNSGPNAYSMTLAFVG